MFAGRTALGAAARGAGGSAGDVDVLLSEIDGMVKAYGKLCSRVEELGAQAARGGRAKKTKEEEEAERLNLMVSCSCLTLGKVLLLLCCVNCSCDRRRSQTRHVTPR